MHLVVLEISEPEYGNLQGKIFDLKSRSGKETLILGRQGGNDIILSDISVSRRHLEIQVEGAELLVRDLDSKNGTRIDGRLLPPQTQIRVTPGSKVQVGEVVLGLQTNSRHEADDQPTGAFLLKGETAVSLGSNQSLVHQVPSYSNGRSGATETVVEQAVSNHRQAVVEVVDLPAATPSTSPQPSKQLTTLSSALAVEVLAKPEQATTSLQPIRATSPETNLERVNSVAAPQATAVRHPLIRRGAEISAHPPALRPTPVIELKVAKKEPRKKLDKASDKAATTVFPNFMQMQSRIPQSVWNILRFFSVILAVAVCTLSFVTPDLGLFIFWGFFIPLLPLIFFLAPGLWRNICPMATLNQLPRMGGFTRALTLPNWLKEYSYVIGIGLFMLIVPARKALFNHDGAALGFLMAAALGTAFFMGTVFKGKSGWCSSICPLLPIQRIYGQTPFVTVRNSHCQPCVGCTKNCYDFNPAVAYVADLHDDDPHYANYRKFFAGAFPGLILAFYRVPNPPDISIVNMYIQFGLYIAVSIGAFFALSAFLKVSATKITAFYAALAFNLYYWFNLPPLLSKIEWLSGISLGEWANWTLSGLILVLTLVWLIRTYYKEPLFIARSLVASAGATKAKLAGLRSRHTTSPNKPEVIFMPQDKRVDVKADSSLLEIIECNDMQIEAGCRMGMCGADPVAIIDGMDNLSTVGEDEQNTLERLGLSGNNRLACCARVRGSVTVSLKPERQKMSDSTNGLAIEAFEYDTAVQQVVIIGNGIAGVTAADHIRRRHPECEIQLIGREPHHLYNRMGISRLIYGRSAMQGLHLLPDDWYEEYKINCWLNTQATRINRNARQVVLGTGEAIPYDRLILAMGSSSTVPPFANSDLSGVFVLREAFDAMSIRSFVQAHGCRRAVVAGGGLLGLEACYALQKLGLKVTVLERSKSLLRRQLDSRAGQILSAYLQKQGLEIALEAELAAVQGTGRVKQAILKDGRVFSTDLLLVAAGITPNLGLAQEAGLEVNKGVVVDDYLQTNDPDIFAIGDLAEHRGQLYGLWPAAVEQAETAAMNSIGGSRTYDGTIAATALKVVGIDLMSIGRFEQTSPEDLTITLEDSKAYRYRKLVISEGKLVGAILLGYPELAPYITALVKKQQDVTPFLEALRAGGDWQKLV